MFCSYQSVSFALLLNLFLVFFFKKILTYWAASGLDYSMWDLCCGVQALEHAGSVVAVLIVFLWILQGFPFVKSYHLQIEIVILSELDSFYFSFLPNGPD